MNIYFTPICSKQNKQRKKTPTKRSKRKLY